MGRVIAYEFRVVPHSILLGQQMVEFWRDGQFVAGIYPHDDGIRIVSKYLDGVEHEAATPPSIIIKFSPLSELEKAKRGGSTPDNSPELPTSP